MAFAALGTLLAGGAATMSIGAIIAGVGTGLSIVGAVTGNQGMMKLGGVMGLVGGVSSLLTSTTAAAGEVAGSVAGSAAEETGSAVFNAAKDSQLANVAIEAGGGDALAGYAADGAANWGAAADDAMKSMFGAPTEAGKAMLNPETAFDSVAKDSIAKAPDVTPNAAQFESSKPLISTQSTLTNPDGVRINNPSAYTSDSSSSAAFHATPTKDYFKDFLSWVKNNEKVSEGILKIGGSALDGMNQRSMFDEKMAFEKSRGQYGNVVADVYGIKPRSLIGARA